MKVAIVDLMVSDEKGTLLRFYQLYMYAQKKLGVPEKNQIGLPQQTGQFDNEGNPILQVNHLEQRDIQDEGKMILRRYGRYDWDQFRQFWGDALRYIEGENVRNGNTFPRFNYSIISEALKAVVQIPIAPPSHQIESEQAKEARKKNDKAKAFWKRPIEQIAMDLLPDFLKYAQNGNHDNMLQGDAPKKVIAWYWSQLPEEIKAEMLNAQSSAIEEKIKAAGGKRCPEVMLNMIKGKHEIYGRKQVILEYAEMVKETEVQNG